MSASNPHAQFICLHLTEVQPFLTQECLLHGFAVLSGSSQPIADRSLVEIVRVHDSLRRAAVRQQGQDQRHQCGVRLHVMERCAVGLGEGLVI